MDKLKPVALGLLILIIGYNLYTGATIQKVGIPGLFEIEFGHGDARPPDYRPSGPESPSSGSSNNTGSPGYSPSQPPQHTSVSGNWTGSVGDLELTVTKVEAVRQIGDKDILRFSVTVNNQYASEVILPLFQSFLAVDNTGHSYKADLQLSDWPQSFPAGMTVAGSIELEDPVPQDITTLNISFSNIFGFTDASGKSLSVSGISAP